MVHQTIPGVDFLNAGLRLPSDNNTTNSLTMQKTLSPNSTVQERKLLFDASMLLIGNGRFLNATMQEIAFQARMSEATVAFIFENRTQLLAELIDYTAGNIHDILDESTRLSTRPYKERFFDLWTRLYNHYVSTPGLSAFLQQFDILSRNAGSLLVYPGYAPSLANFFKNAPSGLLDVSDAETVAYLFHENVLTAAQMRKRATTRPESFNSHMPDMLWKYLAENN